MKRLLPSLVLVAFLATSCFENSTPPNQLSAASCPAAAVSVLKVAYNEAQGKYLIFHTSPPNGVKIANPLSVENLQMSQIPTPESTKGDIAQLNFKSADGKCNPILEMTQGFKIELASANSSGGNVGSGSSSSSGSYWAPFLMGALVGNAVSGALQPRYAPPAYYLPPPAGASGQGGLVTGGVSGKTPDEMNKKYESQYKQSPKKGFFSRSSPSASPQDTQKKKSGFFSGGGSSSNQKSGGFFKKKKR